MTYPSGAPGGYPGQGPHQPQPGQAPGPAGYGQPAGAGGGLNMSPTQYLALGAGALGVLNLFLGFAPLVTSRNFYEFGHGWVPALLAIGGLLFLPVFLEKQKVTVLPAAVTTATMLSFLFVVFSVSAGLSAGGILILIMSILQAGAAIVAYLFEIGVIKPPAPNPYGAQGGYPQQPGVYQPQQPGGAYPQSGAFPAQPGQPGQPPQTGSQPTMQQPPPGSFGAQPGQQTQFAPQQGQFGAPGTPPGGYPQQPSV